MKKVDATVLQETKYVSVWVLILSVLMQSVFLVIGKWDYTVLLGNLLSGAFSVLNFFLMGLTVQSALGKDEKEVKNAVKLSQTYRSLMMFAMLAVGVLVPVFNTLAVVIPVVFPRISFIFRPMFDKKQ
ncbi:MAG: hypothetical protein E7491_06800 [Ruminococcaceae bacterium]|nr:hypothetical protein [Oscillospiraceae bacterium]